MAHDEKLAQRMRQGLANHKIVTEQPMFGGICFLLNGNMLCGVQRDRMMFRVGKEQDEEALLRPGARPMTLTGRVMVGFIFVDPDEVDAKALRGWIDLATKYVGELPAKIKKPTAPKKSAPATKTKREATSHP